MYHFTALVTCLAILFYFFTSIQVSKARSALSSGGWCMGERPETRRYCLQQTRSVCARERSDEAIHLSTCGAMDCFASLAMTAEIVCVIIEGLIRRRKRAPG